jgi:hypothetical protein
MDYSIDIVQSLMGLVIAGLAWWMSTTWKDVRELAVKLAALELVLAKEYRTKAETDTIVAELNSKLAGMSSLELLTARMEVTLKESEKKLESIDSRLTFLVEEVIKNAK